MRAAGQRLSRLQLRAVRLGACHQELDKRIHTGPASGVNLAEAVQLVRHALAPALRLGLGFPCLADVEYFVLCLADLATHSRLDSRSWSGGAGELQKEEGPAVRSLLLASRLTLGTLQGKSACPSSRPQN